MDNFKNVSADPNPSVGVITYLCPHMEPGKVVDMDLQTSFQIDNPQLGGGWVTMEATLRNGSSLTGGHCFGSSFDDGKQCNMAGSVPGPFPETWHLSGTVPADGVVELKIHVSRAYDQKVHQHSLSSDAGTIEFKTH